MEIKKYQCNICCEQLPGSFMNEPAECKEIKILEGYKAHICFRCWDILIKAVEGDKIVITYPE